LTISTDNFFLNQEVATLINRTSEMTRLRKSLLNNLDFDNVKLLVKIRIPGIRPA